MTLIELPEAYTILRYLPSHPIPKWIDQSKFYSIAKTSEELSIVCESRIVQNGHEKKEDGWRCLKVLGPLDFSLTGILSSIATPLANAQISIFAISTFDTDYLLVKEAHFTKAKKVLSLANFTIELEI